MATYFVSDLHLAEDRAHITRTFERFLRTLTGADDVLYILGDLFDYWIGDDDNAGLALRVRTAMQRCHEQGTAIHLMHGNRDFLLGDAFAAATGARLVPDPERIDLYGSPTLLTHGDTLCTGDAEYQAFRALVRSQQWRREFLAKPLDQRRSIALGLRADSERTKRSKSPEIMDVSIDAVEAALRTHRVQRLIHGHTHRSASHLHTIDGHRCERWVLADWYRQGECLRVDPGGWSRISLAED